MKFYYEKVNKFGVAAGSRTLDPKRHSGIMLAIGEMAENKEGLLKVDPMRYMELCQELGTYAKDGINLYLKWSSVGKNIRHYVDKKPSLQIVPSSNPITALKGKQLPSAFWEFLMKWIMAVMGRDTSEQ